MNGITSSQSAGYLRDSVHDTRAGRHPALQRDISAGYLNYRHPALQTAGGTAASGALALPGLFVVRRSPDRARPGSAGDSRRYSGRAEARPSEPESGQGAALPGLFVVRRSPDRARPGSAGDSRRYTGGLGWSLALQWPRGSVALRTDGGRAGGSSLPTTEDALGTPYTTRERAAHATTTGTAAPCPYLRHGDGFGNSDVST